MTNEIFVSALVKISSSEDNNLSQSTFEVLGVKDTDKSNESEYSNLVHYFSSKGFKGGIKKQTQRRKKRKRKRRKTLNRK